MVVSQLQEQHDYLSHERIHFNGQLHVRNVVQVPFSSGARSLKSDRFSLLYFTFVPLKVLS